MENALTILGLFDLVAELKAVVADCKGRRRARTLNLNDVLQTIKTAGLNKDGIGIYCAGSVANAYRCRSVTTMCLAVRLPSGDVRVAVVNCDGNKPSIGRAFGGSLRGLQKRHKAYSAKIAEWAATDTGWVIPAAVIDALRVRS